MSESWATLLSYSLHDLLMFSAATYFGLFEGVNRRSWPAALLGQAVAMGVLTTLSARVLWPHGLRPSAAAFRVRDTATGKEPALAASKVSADAVATAWVTALTTAAVAGLYFHGGFADIHWLGPAWTWAFFGHAAVWLAVAGWLAIQAPSLQAPPSATVQALGLALVLCAVCWPALAPMGQRVWWQAEVVGLAPDPTVLLGLGLMLWLRLPRLWSAALLLLPLAWCLFSGATLWALKQPQALVLPLAGGVALLCCLRRRPSP